MMLLPGKRRVQQFAAQEHRPSLASWVVMRTSSSRYRNTSEFRRVFAETCHTSASSSNDEVNVLQIQLRKRQLEIQLEEEERQAKIRRENDELQAKSRREEYEIQAQIRNEESKQKTQS
jgi:hypothetical protein